MAMMDLGSPSGYQPYQEDWRDDLAYPSDALARKSLISLAPSAAVCPPS
ncbi:MAG: hypothetical protein A4E45_01957 [Methanosaeta sp. PtaB.Bin039]|nr:MAG: hypothetical protein A4E45_01957 [Methanosaeta sp. PtaB.Bin039]